MLREVIVMASRVPGRVMAQESPDSFFFLLCSPAPTAATCTRTVYTQMAVCRLLTREARSDYAAPTVD